MARQLRLAGRLQPGPLLGALILAGCAPASSAPDPPSEPPVAPAVRLETTADVTVRRDADVAAARRGLLMTCAVVEISAQRDGPGCEQAWGELTSGGWICLDHTIPTDAPVPTEHPLMAFDHPTREERADYARTGTFDRDRGPAAEALLPYVYGRRAGRFKGRCWADVEAAQAGEPPVGTLDASRRQHFVDVVETEEGAFLTLADGRVVPVDDVYLYAPTRFEGVDLIAEPQIPGTVPAWVRAGGGRLRAAAALSGELIRELTVRERLAVGPPETGSDGRTWLPVHDASGPIGWVAAGRVRRLRALPPPQDVGESLWIDVDLGQQVLTVLRGTEPEYVTLTSTGVPPHDATPQGLFRIGDKMLHWDMASRADAPEDRAYHLEEVPWVMHYWPRFAIHGAFWHDGFGEPRSHGCINLGPKDARAVFERTSPSLPPGWHTAWEAPDAPGTLLRIRSGQADVPDRRSPLE
jgi:hypothetical protein